jgi:hypothetical protein
MDGIAATIWASQTTIPHGPPERRQRRKRKDQLNDTRPRRSTQNFEAQQARHAARRIQLNATVNGLSPGGDQQRLTRARRSRRESISWIVR